MEGAKRSGGEARVKARDGENAAARVTGEVVKLEGLRSAEEGFASGAVELRQRIERRVRSRGRDGIVATNGDFGGWLHGASPRARGRRKHDVYVRPSGRKATARMPMAQPQSVASCLDGARRACCRVPDVHVVGEAT
jgi:hypothetical protein